MNEVTNNSVIDATRCWIERVVLHFNLCPFAHKPYHSDQVRYVVSEAREPESLLQDFIEELEYLRRHPADEVETTVLIHPHVLVDFLDYNDFLAVVDDVLEQGGYLSEFQVASLHPAYQFSGTDIEDAENYTNRSPYPMLHLLREASVGRALESYPDAESIPGRNIDTMNEQGIDRLRQILSRCFDTGDRRGQ